MSKPVTVYRPGANRYDVCLPEPGLEDLVQCSKRPGSLGIVGIEPHNSSPMEWMIRCIFWPLRPVSDPTNVWDDHPPWDGNWFREGELMLVVASVPNNPDVVIALVASAMQLVCVSRRYLGRLVGA